MFPFFSCIHPPFIVLSFFFFFLVSLPLFSATDIPINDIQNNTWHSFMRFQDAGKGSRVDGMAQLKRYFRRFGYLPSPPENSSFTDLYDDEFESALNMYQKTMGLMVSGKLNLETMRLIVSPRCGVGDLDGSGGGFGQHHRVKTTQRFVYFHGNPRWEGPHPITLTYAFSNMVEYLNPSDVRAVFQRSFARWSAVIPVNFVETHDHQKAKIKIGWFKGQHGDGEAFDGVLGVLAHAFAPSNGRFHLDGAERWALDLKAEHAKVAVDLESVVTHEIGHLLGLAHSKEKDSIMYPTISPRTKKVELRTDDVVGIQALYGPNPNYTLHSKMDKQSDMSSGPGMDLEYRIGLMKWSATVIISMAYFFSLGL